MKISLTWTTPRRGAGRYRGVHTDSDPNELNAVADWLQSEANHIRGYAVLAARRNLEAFDER